MIEAVAQRCSTKKVNLEISQNSQENYCARVSFKIKLHAWDLQLLKKATLAQMFWCESCETFKNNFLLRTPLWDQIKRVYKSLFIIHGKTRL